MMRRWWVFAVALCFVSPPVWAAPERVVSLNLCTDQLAVSMVPEQRLRGVSFNAADPALSLVANSAARFPALKGHIEEIAGIGPDMVLMAEGQNSRLQRWLADNGVPVVTIGMPDSIAALQQDTARVAEALGGRSFADTLRARQDATLRQTQLPRKGMSVAVYYPRGFSDGHNTLLHDIITRMGGRNVASEQGRQGMTYLSLEEMIALNPEVLLVPLYDYDVVSQAEELARHPALGGLRARIVPLPGQYLTCPHLGLEALVNAIAAGVRRQQVDSAR